MLIGRTDKEDFGFFVHQVWWQPMLRDRYFPPQSE